MRSVVLHAGERVLVTDPALDRLQRPAQGEQRRAQVMADRGQQEARLALRGGRAGERTLKAPAMPLNASPS